MEVVEFAGHQVEIRRKSFQRRLGVSVHPNGKIRVSSNKTLSVKEIVKFLESHRAWIEKTVGEAENLRAQYPPKVFRSGETFPYLGADYELRISWGEKVTLKFENKQILFSSPTPESQMSGEHRLAYFRSFKKSYRQVAEKVMGQRLQFFAQQMQLYPTGLQFRGQKTIWGSCSPENKISLNFKLIVAPIQVVDYVLIHELAHIKHKNHSHRFWSLVEAHTPHREFSRIWLKENAFKADFLSSQSELNS